MEADLSIGVIWCSQINQVAVMERLMFLPGSLHYKASKELQFALLCLIFCPKQHMNHN